MHKKTKVFILIFTVILGCALVIFLISSSTNTIPSSSNNKLTIDSIKRNYKTETIKSIKQFGEHYILINVADKYNKDTFEIYNLKTGDRDILSMVPNIVTIDDIINENEIVFISDGKSYENDTVSFPFKIRCFRNTENVKSNMDFYSSHETLYLPIYNNVTMGKSVKSIVSDMKLTFNGLDILFGPALANDIGYFSDQTNIPKTSTKYIKEKNQIIISFTDTTFIKELLKNKVLMDSTNLFIKSMELSQKDATASIVVNLKDIGTKYNIEVNRLKNELPFARITFQ